MCFVTTLGVHHSLEFGSEEIHRVVVVREGESSGPSFCCFCGLLEGMEVRELLCPASSDLVPKRHKKTEQVFGVGLLAPCVQL